MRRTLNILWNIFRLASIDNFISLLSPLLTFVFRLNRISCEFFLWCLNIIRCITSSFYADWLDKSFDGTKLFMCGSVRFSLVQFYRNCDYKVQNDWDMSIIFPFGWPDLSVEELFFRVKISFAENKSDWTNRNVKKCNGRFVKSNAFIH